MNDTDGSNKSIKLARWLGLAPTSIVFTLALALSACGGGSGDGNSTPIARYPIGGTVSGLHRTITLQNNLGDDLAVSADGSFVFATTIENGKPFSVTVLQSGVAQQCGVAQGIGAATAAVAVRITCTVNPATYFLPLTASPMSQGGTQGLFVIPTDQSTATPVRIGDKPVRNLGYEMQHVFNAGSLSAGQITTYLYSQQDTVGGTSRFWALDVSSASSLVPRQLTNTTFTTHCQSFHGVKDLNDPASGFLVVGIPRDIAGNCGSGALRFLLIHPTDTAATTPMEVNFRGGGIQILYKPDGKLAGIVSVDAVNNLVIYPDETFSSSTVLLANIGSIGSMETNVISPFSNLSPTPTYAFVNARLLPSGNLAVYRVDHTGRISSNLYDLRGDIRSLANNSSNLYIVDQFSDATTMESDLLQIPLDGSRRAQLVYSETASVSAPKDFTLVGATGTQIILEHALFNDPATQRRSGDIFVLPTTTPRLPQTIASFDNLINAYYAAGDIYVVRMSSQSSGSSTLFKYATAILSPSGSVRQPLLTQSSLLTLGQNPLLQIRNITSASDVGGGEIVSIDLQASTLNPQMFFQPDGTPFKFSADASYPYAFNVSSDLAIGQAYDSNAQYSLLFDMAQHKVSTIRMDKTFLVFARLIL